ncbi:hypothetical protein ACFLTE_10620 [Bacteroidota bacterium]
MSDFSFNIKNSKDFFAKLLADYDDYKANKTISRTALNCAMTAWHLIDWIYYEFGYNTSGQFNKISDFQEFFKLKCPSMQIMHDLTNGTKHYLLTRHQPKIKKTDLHKGSYSNDYSRDYDISTLNIEMNDGVKKYFEDEIEIVVNFWIEYLYINHNIKI